MTTELFKPGDKVETYSAVTGALLGRGIVIKALPLVDEQFLTIEFEDMVPGTSRRTDTVLASNCRKVKEDSDQ